MEKKDNFIIIVKLYIYTFLKLFVWLEWKIELISKKYEECSREKARAFKPEWKRIIFFSYKFFLNEMKKITSKRYRYMNLKNIKNKFTQNLQKK